jgi:hypothetical protein
VCVCVCVCVFVCECEALIIFLMVRARQQESVWAADHKPKTPSVTTQASILLHA